MVGYDVSSIVSKHRNVSDEKLLPIYIAYQRMQDMHHHQFTPPLSRTLVLSCVESLCTRSCSSWSSLRSLCPSFRLFKCNYSIVWINSIIWLFNHLTRTSKKPGSREQPDHLVDEKQRKGDRGKPRRRDCRGLRLGSKSNRDLKKEIVDDSSTFVPKNSNLALPAVRPLIRPVRLWSVEKYFSSEGNT